MHPTMDDIIRQLVDHVATQVVAEVNKRMVSSPDTYTSNALPPDCPSKQRFHLVVKNIASATKQGRVWSVPRDDWHEYRAKPRNTTVVDQTPKETDDMQTAIQRSLASKFRHQSR